jgi:hypothetical protein
MNGLFGRRNFFGTLRKVVTAGGVMSQFQWLRAAPAAAQRGEDYYEKLGVAKIINAAEIGRASCRERVFLRV